MYEKHSVFSYIKTNKYLIYIRVIFNGYSYLVSLDSLISNNILLHANLNTFILRTNVFGFGFLV